MAVAELLGMPKDQLEFQLLYGMGESLQAAIIARGYPVRIYTPIGELIPGMSYLVRRILENTSNDSFLKQDFFQERSAEELLKAPQRLALNVSASDVKKSPPAWLGEPMSDFSKTAEQERMAQAIKSVRAKLGKRYPILLGAREIEGNGQFTVSNPTHPNEVVGLVAQAGLDEANRAVQLAGEAQMRWARTSVSERVACLRKAAQLMREMRYELAAWETIEVGKTWREADADVVEAIDYLEYYSQRMEELADGKALIQVPGERNTYRYFPRGIAVVISPWNFPAAILSGMASAALICGNAVILKPARSASVIAAHIARILRSCCMPEAIVQYLPGSGEEIGSLLARHPSTHVLLFTGSRAVGVSMIQAAAQVAPAQRFIKHVVMEMGGKNAIIVDADADLDAAISGVVRSAFGYGGQKCSAASRVIIHEAVYDRFVKRLVASVDALIVGDPEDPDTDIGPLIDEAAKRRLSQAIAHAREVATVAYEYPASRIPQDGHFIGPTVVTDVSPKDWLAQEELFGPLLCVFRAKGFDDALALANDTDYALTGGVYSRAPSHLERAASAFDVGNLYLNRPITGAVVGRQPFGGHRLSGLGIKAGGPDYLLQQLIPKTICENTTRHGMPLE
jgi:RHH-type proline utilization regulon transcriptional repressor/proline dehydrogenase/delta 1-pyrroline-5-carboxylate dehydrogenase